MICVINSTAIFDDSMNEEMHSSEFCVKCLDIDAELLNKQNAYNGFSKSYSQLEKHCISLELTMQLNQEIFQKDTFSDNQIALEIPEYFENNDLKAQLQAKDTTICKLKEHIKSMRENDKEEKDKHDMDEIETINIKLEHRMFKLDLDPLAPRLLKNKNAHIDCLKYTQDQPNILRGIVKQAKAKQPLDYALDFESRDTNLYTISLDDMLKTSLIYLLSKASKTKSWLWHHRLSHLNFNTLNKLPKDGLVRGIPNHKFKKDHLCSAYALGKSEKSSHQPKAEDTNQEKLYLLHMDLCGLMRVESINEKRYMLVIVDDYSRFSWVKILRSKDEAPNGIIKCIKNIQVRLNTIVCNVRTYNGTEFVNQTLCKFYENIGITHQTLVSRTPQQNIIVKIQNQTLVDVARTMFIFSKALLFLWAEAINTACYTQNRSLIRIQYNKTPYEPMHDKKPDLSFLYILGSLCYPTNDNEDLGKINAKADIGIFVGYAPAKKAFEIYNRGTRKIMETIHVMFD
ncbi:retrovirus-related pol polyprotein from transposon TNT 1-94 [Tanacetum coccineum]